ncbi:RNI-like protein [Gigaspora margarita]|uniref:RNI-like protein n=1 Tax=Gigaspora margarita TaxID=4874 RepID=A0A8H4ASZ3_GIGMA|nr:RNI-like protein [Gigaspora margarita]
MITKLPYECLLKIFNNFNTNYRILFSCLFVCRHWCKIIIPILWSEPTKYYSDIRLVKIYLSALNAEEQALLIPHKINLPNYQKPLFEYSSFTTYLSFYLSHKHVDGVSHWFYKEGYNHYDLVSFDDNQGFAETINAIKSSLLTMFLRTSKNLKYLNISEPIFDKALLEKIQKNITITSLKLRIGNFEIIEFLSEILYKNTTLNTLDISKNDISFKELEVLSKALCNSTALISLILDNNFLCAEGGNALAEILSKNTSLSSLSLHHNQIGSQGVLAIAKILYKNNTLSYLDIGNNQINVEGAKVLSKVLCVNNVLTSLNLSYNSLNSKSGELN